MTYATVINSQMSNDPLLWLLTFENYADTVTLYAANNLEDITSRSNVYKAFPFEMVLPPEDGTKPQSVRLTFPNVGLELMHLIRDQDIDKKPKVKLELVLASAPDKVEKVIDFMEIANVEYDVNAISFELASSSIFARKTLTGKYTQIEFPGLFFSLGAAGVAVGGSIIEDPDYEVTPDPEPEPDPDPIPVLPGTTHVFANMFGDDLNPDTFQSAYRAPLLSGSPIAMQIVIPPLTKPATYKITDDAGQGPKRGNMSTAIGFGSALTEHDPMTNNVVAEYTFPASATARTVYMNLELKDPAATNMTSYLVFALRYV